MAGHFLKRSSFGALGVYTNRVNDHPRETQPKICFNSMLFDKFLKWAAFDNDKVDMRINKPVTPNIVCVKDLEYTYLLALGTVEPFLAQHCPSLLPLPLL